MCDHPSQITLPLPEWLVSYTKSYSPTLDPQQQMSWVLQAVERNIESGGGPFAAAIFDCSQGELLALGVNRVVEAGLSIAHAEMVAIMAAQRRIGSFSLASADGPRYRLVTSCEPCAMCFGAIPWAGLSEVISGATDRDARAIGFDEGPKVADWVEELQQRGIRVTSGVLRTQAIELFARYQANQGTIYNGLLPS